ncbi:MAG: hypothetical protein CSA05_00280 [Bacteroidia bacterium]|nr:MAG: hypothetical protein CSB01_01170 [Bacteroidia bacterium]PIE86501.1 MAG: hypothetical protein CSA05_00280 [Bacteroidia bacterium]
METFLTLIVVVVIAVVFLAINRNHIPQKLKKAFYKKFPKAKNMDWTLNKRIYEVVFYHKGYEKKAKFSFDYQWLETKTVLLKNNIPENILTKVEQKYPKCEFSDLSKIENNKGQNFYKLIINDEGINYLLKINMSNDIIQTRNLTFDKINRFEKYQSFSEHEGSV